MFDNGRGSGAGLPGRGGRTTSPSKRATLKYKKYDGEVDPTEGTKKLPSQLLNELTQPPSHVDGWRPKPKIIELLNMADFTHQLQCIVPVDEPIFQPFPPEVIYSNYEPFRAYEAKLFFRNNDMVPRRIKIVQPDTPYFSIKRVAAPGKELSDKVASGMEVTYSITFQPDSKGDFTCNLIVCTEREKFLVPVYAIGAAAALDLPDVVSFGPAACKLEANQTIFVRNVGSSASAFTLRAQDPFRVAPSQGFLNAGETLQIQLGFNPLEARDYEGELELRYANGRCVYLRLCGTGCELDVGLSSPSVSLLPTYVTKQSQRTFKVVNNSDVAITFSTRMFSNTEDEMMASTQKLDALAGSMNDTGREEGAGRAANGGPGEESDDEETILNSSNMLLTRRLKAMQRDVMLDHQLFGDKNFSVHPAEGTVWPRSEMELVVQFNPDHAREYTVHAFMDVQGRQDRLPLQINAKGLGPSAVFSYDVLDMGDAFANTLHQYEVELQNRGKIDVEYRLIPSSTPMGTRFSFEPSSGHMSGGEIQSIRIHLLSDLLGDFDETFLWTIKGAAHPLQLQFKGRVVGPSFEVDADQLDFGLVSYGFRYTKELTINNLSEIPMSFLWRVPEDVANPKEFQIIPQKGSIIPHGKQKITVEFVSETVQKYTSNLVLDIPKVADNQLTIPIKAECVVPRLMLESGTLTFGDCFLRFPYKKIMRLANDSKLPGKFEILPQDVSSTGIATFTAEPSSGGIPAKGEQEIEVTLTALTLGRLQIPVRMRAIGSKAAPLEFLLEARCLGPDLLFGTAASLVNENPTRLKESNINFGKVLVLAEHVANLHLYNPTPIPAQFKLFIEGIDSVFVVQPREAELQPNESLEVTVRVCLDEVQTFKDVLHVLIQEGADISVPLEASGTGNIFLSEELTSDLFDFSHQFKGRPFQKEVTIYNMGRKSAALTWENDRLAEVKRVHGKAARASGKKFDISMVPIKDQPVFSISPEKATLEPKEGAVFTIQGMAHASGEIIEHVTCMALVGANAKNPRKAYDLNIRAEVATPLLDFSERTLSFHHAYKKGDTIVTLHKSLTLRNISKLPLTFMLKPGGGPFVVDRPQVTLAVDEATTVNVSCDPVSKGDSVSALIKQKLKVEYTDNPQKDAVDLIAKIDFPNLKFESQSIEFGSCLADTTHRKAIRVTNCSDVEVVYNWSWDPESLKEDLNSIASMSMKAKALPKPTAVQLFDILPITGALAPGQSELITYSFFAYPGTKASALSLCSVEGGPTYKVSMTGESNNIKYSVEPQFIDMGPVLYDKTVEKEIVIANNGKVPFDYRINCSNLQRSSVVTPVPASGVVGPGQKEVVKLKICAGIPDRLMETVLVELAHFDPVPIQIVMEGVYPAVSLALPRIKDQLFLKAYEEAVLAAQDLSQALFTTQSLTSFKAADTGRKLNTAQSNISAKSVAKSISKSTATLGEPTMVNQLSSEKKLDLEADRLRLISILVGREQEVQRQLEEDKLQQEMATTATRAAAAATAAADGDIADIMSGVPQDQCEDPRPDSGGGMSVTSGVGSSRAAATPNPSDLDGTAKGLTSPGGTAKKAAKPKAAPPATGPTGKAVKAPPQPKIPELIAANYLVDFGYVVKGTTKARKFRLTNPSSSVASFNFDKSLLELWGFKVDPDAVAKLPGAPENGHVDISFTLQANRAQVQLGPMELILPLYVKNSPPVLITLRANVQVPDLKLSRDVLDFDSVQTGQCKVITVELHNYKQVPCEWQVKRPVENTKAKDWSYFRCEPSEGVLEPDQRLGIKVIFTPVMNRDAPYSQVLPIKIGLNPRSREMTGKGKGATPKISFTPSFVDCGPILPKFEGQTPNEARFQMVNPCNYPVEVFSLDFDTRFLEEDETLRTIHETHYDANGVMYKVPLAPGEGLWGELVDEVTQRKQMEKAAKDAAEAAAAAAVAAAEAAALAVENGEAPPTDAVLPADASLVAEAEGDVGDLDAPEEAPAVQAKKTVVVLYGNLDYCDVGAQADLVSKRYDVPATLFDDLLFEAADLEPPPQTEEEKLAQEAAEADAAATASAEAAAASTKPPAKGVKPVVSSSTAPPSDHQPLPPVDPSKPYYDRTISDLLYDKVFIDPDLESEPGFVAPHEKLDPVELESLLLRGLRQALLAESGGQALGVPSRFAQGLVLNGLASKYVDPPTAARLLMEALGMTPVLPEPEPEAAVEAAKAVKGKPPPVKGAPSFKGAPEPPPLDTPEAWAGPFNVYFIQLAPGREHVLEREAARHKKEAEEQQAIGEISNPSILADAGAAVDVAPPPEAEKPRPGSKQIAKALSKSSKPGTPAKGSITDLPPPPEETLSPEEIAAKAAAVVAERAEAARKVAEEMLNAEVDSSLEAILSTLRPLEALLGKQDYPAGNRAVLRMPDISGDVEQVNRSVLGLKFTLGVVSTELPGAEQDSGAVPEPYLMQIVRRPTRPRPDRPQVQKFKLYTVHTPSPEEILEQEKAVAEAEATAAAAAAAAAKAAKGKKPSTPQIEAPSAPTLDPNFREVTRWVVPPNSTVDCVVHFQSEDIGKFTDTLGFEVVGGEKNSTIIVTGTCAFPQISSDFRNVFVNKVKARPSTPSIARQYIVHDKVFDFGPLLINKDSTGYREGAHPENTTRLRITNNGLFDNTVEFTLKRKAVENIEPGSQGVTPSKASKKPDAKGAKGGKGVAPGGTGLDDVFVLDPPTVDIKIDETIDLTVYAFPTDEGRYDDVIVCKIKDNPTPVEFPISVTGGKPLVQVRLDDGSPPPDPNEAPPPTPPGTATKGKKGAVPDGPVNKLLSEGIVFGRLLCDKIDVRSFIITNPGVLPIKWRLAGMDKVPSEFTITPDRGEIPARSNAKVAVQFNAVDKKLFDFKLDLEILDQQELQGVATSIPIAIKGEAYKIEIDIKFPQPNLSLLDYGLVRVIDSSMRQLSIKNTGKYQIQFNFAFKPASECKNIFSIVPETGLIDPGKETPIQFHLNKDRQMRGEVTLVSNTDISLSIVEPATNAKEQGPLPIPVTLRAVFSKYSVTPQRGMNFGPITYQAASKPKTFEIANLGEFLYDFKLANLASGVIAPADAIARGKTPPVKGKATGKGAVGAALTIGQFTVTPSEGQIQPGARLEVSVVFNAEGDTVYSEKLGISVSERDYGDHPDGIPYEIVGESCIPGIDTTRMESIFEEHTIQSTLDPFNPINNEYGLRERVFNFGAIIADLNARKPSTAPMSGKPGSAAGGKKGAAAAASPEAAAAAAAAILDQHLTSGVRANLKFSNPIKVPCIVKFTITPKGQFPAGLPFPIEVIPSQLVIPPHEFRYAAIQFVPNAIQSYSATFEASVEGGSDPKTKGMTCEVRGEGTLPSISIQEPAQFDPSGRPLLSFGRLLLGRPTTLKLNLRNNGILPASARLDMEPHPNFTLLEGTQTFSVESKKGVTYSVKFNPSEVGPCTHELRLKVQANPFEDYHVALTGEGYKEDVTFDGLPDGSLEQLKIPDGPLSVPRVQTFAIMNHSATKTMRFKWPPAAHPTLSFSPAIGHLLPGCTKDITLTFLTESPVQLSPQEVKMSITQINPKEEGAKPVNWDDRSAVLDYAVAGTNNGEPVSRPEPEPAVTEVPGTTKDIPLKIFATADNAKYECDVSPVMFRPTMMFQTRSFSFSLKNTCTSRLDYRFIVYFADGETIDTSGLYTVLPEGGAVAAGETTTVTVKFSPKEVDDCARLLKCEIPHLDASMAPLERQLGGKVLRPWCHFELPESDYINAGRRNPEMAGPSGTAGESLDPATKVLEFDSLGIKVRNTKRFFVLNPTSVSYEFFWEPMSSGEESKPSPFACARRKGVITAGRQVEMVFEYTPYEDEVAEAFWRFCIPEQNIEVPFLMVGLVTEPRVFFDRPSINFGQTLIGGARGKAIVKLVNSEHLPFQFVLDKNTYDATDALVRSTGRPPEIQFEPSSGTVPPNGSLQLLATFSPQQERSLNYNVVCTIKKKNTSLKLNVKGDGCAIRETLSIESMDSNAVVLAPKGATNSVDFGQVIVNERAVKAVVMINSGTLSYDFQWKMGTNPRVSMVPEKGTVLRGERMVCELSYLPHAPDKLNNYPISCQVINGNKYNLSLNAVGHRPRLDLSFSTADFGATVVYQPGMTPATKHLRLTNNDTQSIAIDPQWTNTEHWQVDLSACVLQPAEVKDVEIVFCPSAVTPYTSNLPLEINGLYTINVCMTGEGSAMRLELVKPEQRKLAFGSVTRGGATRVVTVVNNGRTVVTFDPQPSMAALERRSIGLIPNRPVTLKPRDTADLTFNYRPGSRMRAFAEDFVLDVGGVNVTLLQMTGACLGTELSLASDSLPFGPVVLGSRSVKRLALENTGDVGTKFVWNTAAMGPNFSVFPAEGFLAPRQDVKLDVAFHPTSVNQDIRVEKVRLTVEGGEDQFLTLTGACSDLQPESEAVNFACSVRASCTQSVTLTNPSSSKWNLRPVIQNDFFSGPEFVDVLPNGKAQYTITFKPLSMSTAEQPHEGSVFFPIPDGTGLLYKLIGRAESPVAEGSVERNIIAKQTHVEVLKVSNWLHKPQRFKIIIDRKQADISTELNGPEYVDVPPLSTKDFKLTVFSYTASTTLATVTFKNENSGEFTFYDLKFLASAPPDRGNLILESPVRTLTTSKVTIKNPLSTDVVMKASCPNKSVIIAPNVTLKAKSLTSVEVSYRPLLVTESEAPLVLESPELGEFKWQCKLIGLATNPERSMTFNVPLGGSEAQTFRFTHWTEDKPEYKCTFKNPNSPFKALSAPLVASSSGAFSPTTGVELTLEVVFEPSAVGENLRDTLVVSSDTGGEYLCPLVGRCIPPKPQGPIECGKGSGQVPFTNVFTSEAEFLFSVDNPAFTVKPSEKIGSKKQTNISVSFKPLDPSKPRSGKLTVTCPSQASVAWVYYLQASEEAGRGK